MDKSQLGLKIYWCHFNLGVVIRTQFGVVVCISKNNYSHVKDFIPRSKFDGMENGVVSCSSSHPVSSDLDSTINVQNGDART